MLAYLYFGILFLALVYALREIRESRRKGELVGVDLSGVDADPFPDISISPHHDVPAHGGCDAGGHDAGGFDCGHGGFDGGGHH